MAQKIVFRFTADPSAETPVDYSPGVEADIVPLTPERLAAMVAAAGGKKLRNVRKSGAGHVLVNRKARPRRVVLTGEGEKIVPRSDGAVAQAMTRVSIPAQRAASLAGLDAEQTAAFLARFPVDGSVPADPTGDAVALTAAAFRKVNALVGKALSWSETGKAASETLS